MKRFRPYIAVVVLIATVLAFIYFFNKHRSAFSQIKHLSLITIILILALYLCTLVALILILRVSLSICGKKIGPKENFLLTIYSTIANFFGPLQSGPGVRAVYLKKIHNLSIKSFLLVSLLYYCFFAFISAVFLLSFSRPWWQTLLVLLISVLVFYFGYQYAKRRFKLQQIKKYEPGLVAQLFLATLLQLVLVAIIYYVELKAVNSHISLKQSVTYTGAANFGLFVSLTPGAIGFRETFLLFSEHLHHISTANVLTASLIDRAMYVIFLGILFIAAIALHARDRLQLKEVDQSNLSIPQK